MSYTKEWVIAKQNAEDQGRVFDFDAWIAERNAMGDDPKKRKIIHSPHCLAVAGAEQNDDLCSDGVDSAGNLLPCNPYIEQIANAPVDPTDDEDAASPWVKG